MWLYMKFTKLFIYNLPLFSSSMLKVTVKVTVIRKNIPKNIYFAFIFVVCNMIWKKFIDSIYTYWVLGQTFPVILEYSEYIQSSKLIIIQWIFLVQFSFKQLSISQDSGIAIKNIISVKAQKYPNMYFKNFKFFK